MPKRGPANNDLCNSDLLTHSHHGLSSGEAHSAVAFARSHSYNFGIRLRAPRERWRWHHATFRNNTRAESYSKRRCDGRRHSYAAFLARGSATSELLLNMRDGGDGGDGGGALSRAKFFGRILGKINPPLDLPQSLHPPPRIGKTSDILNYFTSPIDFAYI